MADSGSKPRKKSPSHYQHQINTRVPNALADQLEVVAEVEGHSLSQVVHEALEEHVERKKRSKTWQAKYREWADEQQKLIQSFAD